MNLEPVNRVYKISVLQDSRNAATAAAVNNRFNQMGAATRKVQNNARGAALATRNLGYVAQNASYQIADFFVMLQGGVGVGRALSTQLPQLLAGFGAFGAVLGAVAAIGSSVVVMLQNQKKVQKDITEVTEAYEKALKESNAAMIEFVTTGKAGTRTLKELTAASLALAESNLSEVLTPPDATAWDGYLRATLRALQIIGKGISELPGLDYAFDWLKEVIVELEAYYKDYGDIQQNYENAIYDFINVLGEAQLGTERFLKAFRLLNTELNNQYYILADVLPQTGFPLFDDARDAFNLVITALTELEGTADKSKWSDLSIKQAERFKLKMDEAEEAIEGFRKEYYRLTELQPNGLLQELFRESDLDKSIRSWENALASGLVTATKANQAIAALVEIDRWKPLQDIIIDVGKSFENRIVQAMKTGKFAVEDFITFALEQFARLALSRAFEPFFLLLANSVPFLGGGGGGTGSPSPNVRPNPLSRSMAFEPPASAAPMYNYGESISRIPGATRNAGGAQSNRVTVNVNNYGNDEVSINERQDSNGGIDIDVLIKSKVNSGFARGDYDKVVASAFGLRRLGY